MRKPTDFEADIAGLLEPVLHGQELLLAYPRGRHTQFQAHPAKVTVMVPVYNGQARLERCLKSIASQSFADYQVIVVDNGSTDHSFNLACHFAAEHPKFLVYQNARNVGRVGNWNRCLELATGDYLKPLMVNDFLLSDCLAELAGVLDANPNVALARVSVTTLRDGVEQFWPLFDTTCCIPGPEAIKLGVTRCNPAAGPSAQMFRRSIVEAHQLRFDTGFDWAADYEFGLRLFGWGDLYYLRKPLFRFEVTKRFATQTPAWRELRDEVEVICSSVARFQDRLGPETVALARARVETLFREHHEKCSAPMDYIHWESVWRAALAGHPGLVPATAPSAADPVRSTVAWKNLASALSQREQALAAVN